MAARSRKDRYDIPVQVMLDATLHVATRDRAEELDLSQSGYIRKLIIDDLKKRDEKRLSKSSRASDTPEVIELLRNLNRLLTNK